MAIVEAHTVFDPVTFFARDRGLKHDGRSRDYSFADTETAQAVVPGDLLVVDYQKCDHCDGTGVEPHDPMMKFIAAPMCVVCNGSGHSFSVGAVTVVMGYDDAKPACRTVSTRRPTHAELLAVEQAGYGRPSLFSGTIFID